MPRGNPSIWKKHGASYAELAGTITSIERAQEVAPRRLPPVTPAALAELHSTKPAGAPSLKPHKGVGSFVLQPNWSLGIVPCGAAAAATHGGGSSRGGDGAGPGPSSAAAAAAQPPPPATSRWATVSAAAGGGPVTAGLPPRSYNTETKSNFGPPPPGFQRTRSAGPAMSQFPRPDQPNDWKSSKQVDFRPELITAAAAAPPPPFKAPSSGPLLPTDVPPGSQFVTQNRTHFPGRSLSEAQSLRPSGCRATQAAPYNIITGATPYNNNAFEHWDGRDYRRHR